MEQIPTTEFINWTKEQITDWFKQRIGKQIFVPVKKTSIGSAKGIATQKLFTHDSNKAYAMYLNYEHCISKENPSIRLKDMIISNNKNKDIFMVGYDAAVFQNFVISLDEVPKHKHITVL